MAAVCAIMAISTRSMRPLERFEANVDTVLEQAEVVLDPVEPGLHPHHALIKRQGSLSHYEAGSRSVRTTSASARLST